MSALLKYVVTAMAFLMAAPASAHVKWFSEFSFSDRPLGFTEIATPTFWALLVLSVVVIVLLTWVGQWVSGPRGTHGWMIGWDRSGLRA